MRGRRKKEGLTSLFPRFLPSLKGEGGQEDGLIGVRLEKLVFIKRWL
jgi:hypothetical protein